MHESNSQSPVSPATTNAVSAVDSAVSLPANGCSDRGRGAEVRSAFAAFAVGDEPALPGDLGDASVAQKPQRRKCKNEAKTTPTETETRHTCDNRIPPSSSMLSRRRFNDAGFAGADVDGGTLLTVAPTPKRERNDYTIKQGHERIAPSEVMTSRRGTNAQAQLASVTPAPQ